MISPSDANLCRSWTITIYCSPASYLHTVFLLMHLYHPGLPLCISSLALPFAKRHLSAPLSPDTSMKISIYPAIPLMNILLHRAHVHTQGTGEIYAVATLDRGDLP